MFLLMMMIEEVLQIALELPMIAQFIPILQHQPIIFTLLEVSSNPSHGPSGVWYSSFIENPVSSRCLTLPLPLGPHRSQILQALIENKTPQIFNLHTRRSYHRNHFSSHTFTSLPKHKQKINPQNNCCVYVHSLVTPLKVNKLVCFIQKHVRAVRGHSWPIVTIRDHSWKFVAQYTQSWLVQVKLATMSLLINAQCALGKYAAYCTTL